MNSSFLFLRELFGFQIEKIVSVFYELELSKKKLHAKINNQIYLETIFYFFDSRIGFPIINSTKSFLYSGFSLYRGILFIVKYFPNSAKKCWFASCIYKKLNAKKKNSRNYL